MESEGESEREEGYDEKSRESCTSKEWMWKGDILSDSCYEWDKNWYRKKDEETQDQYFSTDKHPEYISRYEYEYEYC